MPAVEAVRLREKTAISADEMKILAECFASIQPNDSTALLLHAPAEVVQFCIAWKGYRREVRSGKAARRHMEGCRRLGDLLAFAAGKLLAHGLDHLALTRDHLQRLGDVFTQLRQFGRAAARAVGWCGNDDALARQMRWERPAGWTLALESLTAEKRAAISAATSSSLASSVMQ